MRENSIKEKLKNFLETTKDNLIDEKSLDVLGQKVNCLKCGDTGIVLKNDLAFRCECAKKQQKYKFLNKTNMGSEINTYRFENFNFKYYPSLLNPDGNANYYEEAKKIWLACKQFADTILQGDSTKGICLCGSVGSGKTYLAASIANYLLDNDIPVCFAVVPDLIEDLRLEYLSAHNEHDYDLFNATRTAHVLILDDLGAHNYTEWTINKLFSIFNYRITHRLPTIITTNLEMYLLENKLGDRITSRILELCQIYKLNVPSDIRLVKFRELNNK
jgi:DNA replication protein DnaC